MDVKHIYVLINTSKYTKEYVQEEIKKEGYPDKFAFDTDTEMEAKGSAIAFADEVWCFGNCEHTFAHNIAKELGCDIWQMS